MAGAFQSNAFQNSAFQTGAPTPPQVEAPVEHVSGGGRRGRNKRKAYPGTVWLPEEIRKQLVPAAPVQPEPVVGAGLAFMPAFTGRADGSHGVNGYAMAILAPFGGQASGEFFDSVSAGNAILLIA